MMPHSLPYPSRISLAQTPTPLQPLDRLSSLWGGPRLWLKRDDLTGSVLSGNKIRKLEFVVAQALAEGCNTLITCGGIQSNHCRATAFVGAQLGLSVCLVLRGEKTVPADGNLLLDQLAGAEICYTPVERYQHALPELLQERAAHYRSLGKKPFIIPTGASDGIGLWGYIAASEELVNDYAHNQISPEYVVCATGSGGTHAGLTLGHHILMSEARVLGVAVCDDIEYFRRKFCSDLDDWRRRYPLMESLTGLGDAPKPLIDDRFVGAGYGVAQSGVYETIQQLASTEGVVLDPVYTGKAFFGLREMIRNGELDRCHDLVFVHTGGLFGLFPHKLELTCALAKHESNVE